MSIPKTKTRLCAKPVETSTSAPAWLGGMQNVCRMWWWQQMASQRDFAWSEWSCCRVQKECRVQMLRELQSKKCVCRRVKIFCSAGQSHGCLAPASWRRAATGPIVIQASRGHSPTKTPMAGRAGRQQCGTLGHQFQPVIHKRHAELFFEDIWPMAAAETVHFQTGACDFQALDIQREMLPMDSSSRFTDPPNHLAIANAMVISTPFLPARTLWPIAGGEVL